MRPILWRCRFFPVAALLAHSAFAQQALTWPEVRAKFEASNPTLRAGQIGIDESKAQEVTAYLRPNPDMTVGIDQLDPFTGNPYRPLGFAFPYASANYLHERAHKRELRLESAQKGTTVAVSQLADQQRNLLFTLRNAFVQALQAKAVLASGPREPGLLRPAAGGERQPFPGRRHRPRGPGPPGVAARSVRFRRPDRGNQRADGQDPAPDAAQRPHPGGAVRRHRAVRFQRAAHHPRGTAPGRPGRPAGPAGGRAIGGQGPTDYHLAVANGSTDPTFGVDFARNPPIPLYVGFSVNIPLRIFDRNQGEKARTELDIQRNQRLREAAEAQIYSDVDSAWATLNGNLALLRPYKAKYLAQAARVRETISIAYQRGGASLLDFLNAQNDYRALQVTYLNLVGSYLTAAAQLNLAVGREVIQ